MLLGYWVHGWRTVTIAYGGNAGKARVTKGFSVPLSATEHLTIIDTRSQFRNPKSSFESAKMLISS